MEGWFFVVYLEKGLLSGKRPHKHCLLKWALTILHFYNVNKDRSRIEKMYDNNSFNLWGQGKGGP